MSYDGAVLAGLIGERLHRLHIIAVPDCSSTNDIVREYFLNPSAGGAILAITDHQRGGEGRSGRHWYSPAGKDVLMTLGLKHGRFAVPQDSRLPLAICVWKRQRGSRRFWRLIGKPPISAASVFMGTLDRWTCRNLR